MKFRRLREVKEPLARICGSTGMSASDPRVVSYINRAVEELFNEGEWPGIVDQYRATTLDGNFVLPDDFVSVDFLRVDDSPHPVKGKFFELASYGPGPQRDDRRTMSRGALDRGVTSVYHQIPQEDGPWTLRVRSDRAETSGEVLVRGWDDNGRRVDEIRIPLPVTPQTTANHAQKFSLIDESPGGVILPSTRAGEVTISATNGTADVILAHYPVGIEVPQFRRYYIPGIDADTEHTILVRAARRFRPVSGDDDVLQISFLPALELMILALREKDNANVEAYLAYKQTAVAELMKEAKRYDAQEPHVNIRASVDFGFGFDPVW